MCEHYVARAAAPFRLDELWDFTERLEHWGIAGVGWGAAWLEPDGGLASHRDTRAFRDDPARERIGRVETTAALVHLRRPSKLSTTGLPDTQPFDDPAGRYAFSHNGDFERHLDWRGRYQAAGRIRGRADTETGARWLEDAWRPGEDPAIVLGELHRTFGGHANLALLTAAGSVHHYAGNDENPVFAFRLGPIGVISTAIYSIDRSLFNLVAPGATERRLVREGTTASLDDRGHLGGVRLRPTSAEPVPA
jgi:hypothetical protein